MANYQYNGPVPREFLIEVEGKAFRARTISELISEYVKWKNSTDVRIGPDYDEPVWQALKKAYPRNVSVEKKKASGGGSLVAAIGFIRFMTRRMANRSLVSTEEARRRADICFSCPLKQPILACPVCKDALKLTISPPDEVPAPVSCGACGCFLPLKIWAPRDQLGEASAFPFWESCWMRETE